MQANSLTTLLTIISLIQYTCALPTAHFHSVFSPPSPCANITSQPIYQNYTSLYTCTLKVDYAILGLFYDTCAPFNNSSSSSSNTTSDDVTTLFCCDPTYSTPALFDTLCIWGSGVNMSEWRAEGLPAGELPTATEEEMRGARCLVGPIINPAARCVQVGVPVEEEEGEEEGGM